jgi:serine/threonine protein kinase
MALIPPNDGGCPSDDVLFAFLSSELSPAESEAIRSHVAMCPTCDSRIRSPFPSTTPVGTTAEPGEFHSGSRKDFSISGLSVSASTKPRAPAELPQIGQYKLVQQIGKGGMGVVYRAQHLRLKRWVALKLLSDRRLIDAHMVARFEREMEIIGRLDHPNIVRATDAGYADGYHFLAMELIDGLNLLQIAHEQCELSLPNVCEMVRQAAVGLHHAHEHGLIHRDIKPNNLMLSTQGVVKLLDLGLARFSRTEGECLTGTGTVLGTPDYMAPEQWDASKDVDIRADVYSLGCTLHTLLAKQPPFSGPGLDSASRKMAAHLQAPPPRLGEVRPDVPTGVQAVIDRAMAKDPDGRYQKPMEFAEALTEFAHGADLATLAHRTVSVVRVTTDPSVDRNRDLASTANYASQPSAETVGPTRTLPDAGRRTRGRVWLAAGILALAVVSAVYFATRGGTEEQQVLPSPQPNVDLKPKPKVNEWFDLLAVEPTKAVWPQGKAGTDSAWKYDGPNRELWLTAKDRVMVQLGEIDDIDFELECLVSQNPWIGNIGLYFGDRAVNGGHEAITVSLSGFGVFLDKPTISLMLAPVRHIGQVFEDRQILGTSPIPRPVNATCKLWLAVYRTGVYKVQWEGQPDPVRLLPADKQPRPRPTAGGFGVYAQNSTSQIRNVRLRILTSPTP